MPPPFFLPLRSFGAEYFARRARGKSRRQRRDAAAKIFSFFFIFFLHQKKINVFCILRTRSA